MAWVTQASDNFNRANETPLTGGGNWTSQLAAGNTYKLVSNAAAPNDPGSDAWDAYTGRVWTSDQSSKAKISVTGTAGGGSGCGLALRYTNVGGTSLDAYRFVTDHAASGNCKFSLFVGGVSTGLLTFTQAWTNGDTWQFTIQGPANNATLKAYLNDVLVAAFTDTGGALVDLPGSPGLVFSSTETAASLDDWEGGEFAADTPPANATPAVAWWGA